MSSYDCYDEDKSLYKWLVLIGSFFNYSVIFGVAWGAGVFQVIFMEVFGGNVGILSIIPTLMSAFLSFVGPASSALTNRFGCRIVTFAGGLLGGFGLMFSSFAKKKRFLFGTFTLVGIGLGLALTPSVVILCYYFKKKRALASAIAASGLGVGTLLIPPFIRFLVNEYQWSGSLLIIGAFTLNISVAAALFRPVRIPDVDVDQQERKILQFHILRHMPLFCFFISNIFILYGIVAFYLHLPAYAFTLGFSDDTGALFVSLIGAATILSRILCGFFIQKFNSAISVYVFTQTFGGICMMICPFVQDTTGLFVVCAGFGLGTGTLGPLLPLIVTDLVGIQALTDGYGYILVAEGVGSLLGPPISGFLYDTMDSYMWSFCSAGLAVIFGSLVMVQPLYHKHNVHKIESECKNFIGEPLQLNISDKNSVCSRRPLISPGDSNSENAQLNIIS